MTPIINVAEHLARMAAEHPTAEALHFPFHGRYFPQSFADLNHTANQFAYSLNQLGISRGTRTVLMVPPGLQFFALTFALFKLAAVPILIDPGMGVRNLGPCLATAEPEAFIGVTKAHLARWLFGWGKPTIKTTINVGRGRLFSSKSLHDMGSIVIDASRKLGRDVNEPYPSPPVKPDDLAAILFTSGSTGPAKGVEYTHGIFASQVEMLKQTYGIQPGEIDFCTFPLFALFGPALGMTCVVPDMDASRPARIDAGKAVNHINEFGVTNFFGSPAVLRALGGWGVNRGWVKPGPPPPADSDGVLRGGIAPALPTVRRVISAGAPARADEVERFARLLNEGVEVFTPYGATECLPVANIGSREILTETRAMTEQGKGVCIGRPVAGIQLDVIRISDDAIPEWSSSLRVPDGEVGEFVVRGPVVTKRYYGNAEATRRAKIVDPATGETLHRMGDVGYRDASGRFWFCGRKSHRVVTPQGTLFTDMVEPIFLPVKYAYRTALVGVTRSGITYPVLCWQGYDGPAFRGVPAAESRRIEADLRTRAMEFEMTKSIVTFLQHLNFPMDVRHNSKIFREKLAVWAGKRLGPKWNGGPE